MQTISSSLRSLYSQGEQYRDKAQHPRSPRHRRVQQLAYGGLALLAVGCKSLVDVDYPPNVANPGTTYTPTGAVDLYRAVVAQFRSATTGPSDGFVVNSGTLGDELNAGAYANPYYPGLTTRSLIDSRSNGSGDVVFNEAASYTATWRNLFAVRTRAMIAIAALQQYAPNAPKDYVGHSYALWAMSEIMLADLFCSGIPLTTVQLDGGFTPKPGSTSQEVYEHAVALFDSALAYTPDSSQFRNLARVGKGWALINLNRYDEAAAAVREVPTDFRYLNLHYAASWGSSTSNLYQELGYGYVSNLVSGSGTVSDQEGGNGLPYISSGDPRTKSFEWPTADYGYSLTKPWVPERWVKNAQGVNAPGSVPILMASGVEARLIEAEAALKRTDARWLTILDDLRTNGTIVSTAPNPNDATKIDTTWGRGTGAVLFTASFPGLAQITDPGTIAGRVDLLFQERAYWLFLTGRRLGDMRRLIRQYGRDKDTVFPIGPYPVGPAAAYGNDVNIPAPAGEKMNNVLYTGCINRDA